MKLIPRISLSLAVALAVAMPVTAFATNGMFMIGYGAKATAMGGAGVAYPQDAMITAYNPAGMTEVGEMRLDATLELFHPPRSVSSDSTTIPTDARSKDDFFPIPAIGAVMSDKSTPMALGMAIVGAGLGTRYPQPSTGNTFFNITGAGYKEVGVFLMHMDMLPSMAFKLDEHNSVGASVVIAMQTFRAFGLEDFAYSFHFTDSVDNLTNRGNDWSFGGGYRLGWLGTYFDKRLNLGLNLSPKVHMQKFNLYSGLFANDGEFDIPKSYTVGLAFKFTPKTTVAFDYQQIYWSEVPSIGHEGPTATGSPLGLNPLCPGGSTGRPECSLGGSLGMGFGWRNQKVYKFGVDHKYNKSLTLRAGYNYARSPIPEDQVMFNMLAPATSDRHYTMGATFVGKGDSDITFTFMYSPQNIIKGPTMFQGTSAALAMSQTSLSVAYGLKF